MIIDFYGEVEALTKDLVGIESIVKGGNETVVAEYVFEFYKNLDYFKEHPEQLILQKTLNDEYNRHSTIALLKGNGKSNKTIVLMGHTDTVGVDDYGKIKEYAFSPDELPELLKTMDIDDETLKDIESGEFMFGRGALDMKSGFAGHMAIMKYFAENRELLNGNLVAIAACDEEDGSRGIISSLEVLAEWKERYDLDYLTAINADYSTPYYTGDENRYIYLGTIGKILPTFYMTGKETHVGQAFGGLDPNLIAAEITRNISLNTELCDTSQGETTVPPISLKQEDLKTVYTVQTALAAHSYFNFFTHGMTPGEVFEKLKVVATNSCQNVYDYLNVEYKKWCDLTGYTYNKIDYSPRVYTWDEFTESMKTLHGDEFKTYMDSFMERLHREHPEMDLRIFNRTVVEEAVSKFDRDSDPLVIIYNSSVYSQNIEVLGKNDREKNLIESLNTAVDLVQETCDENIVVKYFYPYISDSSFVYIPEDIEDLNGLLHNTPGLGVKFIHPVGAMKKISMPVANIGTYGKDGHKFTERVHKDFTFQKIPNITLNTILELLK